MTKVPQVETKFSDNLANSFLNLSRFSIVSVLNDIRGALCGLNAAVSCERRCAETAYIIS